MKMAVIDSIYIKKANEFYIKTQVFVNLAEPQNTLITL